MATPTVNVLLTSFPGLNLPPTLSLPLPADTPISTLNTTLQARLPDLSTRILLTTSSNKQVLLSSPQPISTLLAAQSDTLLPLRLSTPLCGGKGGFGSQLRAAGGRMSSKRKKASGGENNGSNRNLDGRRLRTVTEAKALAEYLALKPEMEKKEKEARRKKWEQVVEMAERREDELRGKRGKVDGAWVEDKEEQGERTREAVRRVMEGGEWRDNLRGEVGEASGSTGSEDEEEEEEEEREEGEGSSSKATTPEEMEAGKVKGKGKEAVGRSYFGFDEDDEFMSESEDGDGSDGGVPVTDDREEVEIEGKGKSRA